MGKSVTRACRTLPAHSFDIPIYDLTEELQSKIIFVFCSPVQLAHDASIKATVSKVPRSFAIIVQSAAYNSKNCSFRGQHQSNNTSPTHFRSLSSCQAFHSMVSRDNLQECWWSANGTWVYFTQYFKTTRKETTTCVDACTSTAGHTHGVLAQCWRSSIWHEPFITTGGKGKIKIFEKYFLDI